MPDTMYGVVVRDGADLILVMRIRRNAKGEIFVLLPREDREWDPHVSLHEDGSLHIKSHGGKILPQKIQKPDKSFRGTEAIWTNGIASDEPRLLNIACVPTEFAEVFEIPVGSLRPEKYRTHVSVNLVAPGLHPAMPTGTQVLHQRVFKNSVPWIVVTLADFAWMDTLQGGGKSP